MDSNLHEHQMFEHKFAQAFRIMKVTAFAFFTSVFSMYATEVYPQSAKISMQLQHSTTMQVIDAIEKQTNFLFVYNDNEVNMKRPVSINATNQSIEEILDHLFAGTDVSYRISGKNIILVSNKKENNSTKTIQEERIIKGNVSDQNGEAIIGANILIKGSTNGTITDINGNFSLNVKTGQTLQISYIGYRDYTQKLGNQKFLTVTLLEDSKALDEVVVVGYGTQKKVNLTGSVSTVNSKTLAERPTSNVTTLLQGQVPGLQVTQSTGQPGAEGATMQIRGMGTFSAAGTAPMVLVDGVAGSLSALSPNEIESISVLKDAASAAIYGARAANGVILVTTKNGKQGKAQISYHGNVGWQQATVLPDLVTNSVEYMEMYNQMADHTPGKVKYPEEYIDLYRDPNRNKNLYPDYDWVKETFKTGFIHSHNVTATGGNDKVIYNLNFSYMNQDGILPCHSYERFTGRANIEGQLHEKIKVGAKVAFYNGNIKAPAYQNEPIMLQLVQQRPMYKPYLPDGSGRYTYTDIPFNKGGEWVNRNPVYVLHNTSSNTENWRWDAQAYIDVELFKNEIMDLGLNTKAALSISDSFNKRMEPNDRQGFYYHPFEGSNDYTQGSNFEPTKAGVDDRYDKDKQLTLYATLNYNLHLGQHDLGALIGYNQETYKGRWLDGYRKWYPSYSMEEIDGGSPTDQKLSGNSSEWGLASFFGRLNYAYAGKYLAEANFRYDGTSRIYKDNRWGIFPSFSGAWRISEENFIKDKARWINNLKFRLSWGKLGNQAIGNYAYHDVYESSNVINGNEITQAMNQNRLTDKNLTWEETAITNVGLDASLWNNRLYFTVDWYNKITSGILNQAPIPASVGLGAPIVNYGKLRNRGVEFQVGHQNQIKDFTYGVSFMATFNKNKVLQLRAPSYNSYIYEEGLPYGEHYIYEWIGLFQSEEEIANSAKHPYKARPGDLKLKDQNNDGVINSKDKIVVSGKYPKMLYSFNINMAYKNFDLTAFFQGVAGRKVHTTQFIVEPFSQGGAPGVEFRDAWTPEHTDTNVPALYGGFPYYKSDVNRSTYFLRDASYLRLKNLQVGYNFKKNLINKLGLNSLRIYFSGDNLLTFTDYPHLDPEKGGDGRHVAFPQLKTYSIGLDVKF